jgi:hypothetical protein
MPTEALQSAPRPEDGHYASLSNSRLLSTLEVLLGAGLVIGHNVLRVLPNEVPILVVLALISARLRNGGWQALGFKRPESWPRVVLIALAAATLRILLGEFVIDPFSRHFWPPAALAAGAEHITGSGGRRLIGTVVCMDVRSAG